MTIELHLDLESRPPNSAQPELINELCDAYLYWKTESKNEMNRFWVGGGEWENYNQERSFFYDEVLKRNSPFVETNLCNFWRNELGAIVKEYAKFPELMAGQKKDFFIESVSRNIKSWLQLYNQDPSKLYINHGVGNPWGLSDGKGLIPSKSARFHHNATQIATLLKKISHPVIGEVGGGYGGLCEFLSREIPKFTYINFDLPETLLISAYYLKSVFKDKKVFVYSAKNSDLSDLQQYDIVLLPCYLIDSVKPKSIDLFFNSFSLSEMPPQVNAAYLERIQKITKSYFLHNNMDRKGVVNRGHERIPSSEYPLDEKHFTLLYKSFDQFHGFSGDYKEFLYQIN